MRRYSLLLPVILAACDGSVSGVGDLTGDVDTRTGGDDINVQPDDGPPPIPTLVAEIVGDSHVVDDANAVTLDAVPVTASEASYTWDFGDGQLGSGLRVNHNFLGVGCHTVTLTVAAPGHVTGRTTANVYAPTDTLSATVSPLPVAHGFVPREPGAATGVFTVSGNIVSAGWQAIAVDTVLDGTVVQTTRNVLCSKTTETFVLLGNVPVDLHAYDIVVRAEVGERSEELASTQDLVAGDVIVIQGQSNAESANFANVVFDKSPFLRSFGSSALDETGSLADSAWHLATNEYTAGPGAIGQWGMKMSLELIAANHVPLAVLNGAHGGQPIAWFQRDDANHANTAVNYGRLLRRMKLGGLDQHVRAILYFQGESDGGNATGHRDGFTALYDDWRDDFPTIEKLYITQVRPGCGDPSLELRNFQRTMGSTLPNAVPMSTSAMDSHDGCHYQYENGYRLLGEEYSRLLGRDLYGVANTDVQAIDVVSASYDAGSNTLRVRLRSDASAFTVEAGAAANFAVVGTSSTITDVTVDGTTLLVLHLSAGSGTPTEVRYNAHQGVGATVLNAKGVGLLAFILAIP